MTSSFKKNSIGFKIIVTLVFLLVLIFGLLSTYLIQSRKMILENTLLSKGRMSVLVGAKYFSHYLENLIDLGVFSLDEIFDENYQLIADGPLAYTEDPKFHTKYDEYLDRHIQEIEDSYLEDDMVVFAVLVDRNGYLPTHNSRYSKPLTGIAKTDRINNRTKRIFNDPVGTAAARNDGSQGGGPVLKQIYPRDTGVMMWDLSAPVFVKDKHWGAFRIGFSMDEVNASIQHLTSTIILTCFSSLVACSLFILYLIPKYTDPLRLLTKHVEALSGGRFKQRIELKSNDEIGVLVKAFNEMGERLEKTTVSRDFYDMLVNSMHDLLFVTDSEGTIVGVNKATCDFLKSSEEQLKHQEIHKFVKLRADRLDWFSEMLSVPRNFTTDVFITNHSDEQSPMALSCSPLMKDSNTPTGFILLCQDNSKRYAAEIEKEKAFREVNILNAQLAKTNQELENAYGQLKNSQVQVLQQEKMASIGQLAAGVAHEINNPMGFITSNLGTLKKYICKFENFISQQSKIIDEKVAAENKAELDKEKKKLKIDYLLEDSQDLLDESLDGADRVKTIVQNLKSFSRIDSDTAQDIDINECIESTINIAWNELKYKVTLEKDYGSLPMLHCHPQKLNQVFLNILVNAAQAVEEQGTVTVKSWHENSSVFISIQDTGSGIPPENLSRIFEPFFTTKEVGKGTGLGMSISYDIIKAHGGEIRVQSTVGEGTTFTIVLPCEKEQ